jgi:hypothetical protein
MGNIGLSILSSSEEKGEGGSKRGEGSGGIMVLRVQEGCRFGLWFGGFCIANGGFLTGCLPFSGVVSRFDW